MGNGKDDLLARIKEEVVNLKESSLCQERIENKVFPVIGEGSHYAKIMFIGEAPGQREAETGRPFAGAAGRVLNELLNSIELERKDVYITNVVKDRPPQNRDPLPEEIEMYAPFLERQINIIQPTVIVTLGRFSMEYVMKKFGLESKLDSISKLHGRLFDGKASFGAVKILPLYHPAVALYNGSMKETLKKDFHIVKTLALD